MTVGDLYAIFMQSLWGILKDISICHVHVLVLCQKTGWRMVKGNKDDVKVLIKNTATLITHRHLKSYPTGYSKMFSYHFPILKYKYYVITSKVVR